MINKKNNKINKSSGFTLVETMFAVIIMTISLTAFMGVVANSMFSAKYAKNEITANYLLQEVVDYIRNDRDSMVFRGDDSLTADPWESFVSKYINTCSGACEIGVMDNVDGLSPYFKSCDSGKCHNLYFDPNATEGSFYTYSDREVDGKTKTTFVREITATQISNEQVMFKVIISWKNGNNERTRSLDTILTRWQ